MYQRISNDHHICVGCFSHFLSNKCVIHNRKIKYRGDEISPRPRPRPRPRPMNHEINGYWDIVGASDTGVAWCLSHKRAPFRCSESGLWITKKKKKVAASYVSRMIPCYEAVRFCLMSTKQVNRANGSRILLKGRRQPSREAGRRANHNGILQDFVKKVKSRTLWSWQLQMRCRRFSLFRARIVKELTSISYIYIRVYILFPFGFLEI